MDLAVLHDRLRRALAVVDPRVGLLGGPVGILEVVAQILILDQPAHVLVVSGRPARFPRVLRPRALALSHCLTSPSVRASGKAAYTRGEASESHGRPLPPLDKARPCRQGMCREFAQTQAHRLTCRVGARRPDRRAAIRPPRAPSCSLSPRSCKNRDAAPWQIDPAPQARTGFARRASRPASATTSPFCASDGC